MAKNKQLHVHFMGIGGAGISGVARMAAAKGFKISGCDLEEGRATRELTKEGVDIKIGHSASHLKGVDLLVNSPATFYREENLVEYNPAKKKKMALTWEEYMVKHLQKGKFVIAVSGTHGKGTTSAMLATILERAGMDPTCEIGANLLDWGKKNYRLGGSEYFLCEADEFRDKFLFYSPSLIVMTSIEMDHPEYFPNFEAVIESFKKFVARLVGPKILVINGDDKGCQWLIKSIKSIKAIKIIKYHALKKSQVKLKLPGDHIRSDAAAAWAAATALKVSDKIIKESLQGFSGSEGRFEYRGEVDGVKIYDDYAHHPTAVTANIKAARELFPKKKIWVVFQPHMYSRLERLFADFAQSLRLADRVVVTDVFTRREHGIIKPSGKDLAIGVGSPKATYVGGDLTNVANFISRNTSKGDVVLVMGAGDVYKVSDQLLAAK